MWTNGKNFLSGHIRGMNLGNMLESPSEGDWGTKVQDRFFPLIKERGFDFVRIPIKWSAHTSGKDDEIDPQFFARIDHVVSEAQKNGLPIVLNMHHFNEINKEPEKYENKLYNIWEQLAPHYKDLSDDVVFEINNEPNGKLDTNAWNPLQKKCAEIIRKSNPMRKIMISGGNWGGYSGLYSVDIPDDPNLIASFHFYDPFNFTHQGAGWTPNMNKHLGTKWTGSESEKSDILKVFGEVKAWGDKHNLPIFMGEFGAYEKADMESRARWTRFVSEEAEKHGFSWCYWEFCSGFGVYDLKSDKYRDELADALTVR